MRIDYSIHDVTLSKIKGEPNTMSEEVTFMASSPANGGVAYSDDDVPSNIANAPPRLGRSKIFAREELMYANNQPTHQQYQRRTSTNLGYRGPSQKPAAIHGPNTAEKLRRQCPENSSRRSKASGSRRAATKDIDFENDNPLQRYENALSRYRKSGQVGPGNLRKDRQDPHYKLGNTGYSSSDDSEEASPRCNKSKSTSSIDTQSVNNILDEYEDLDYGRSSDLSDSGSISVTNFEVVMDQRKRHQQQQQQQQQNTQGERSKEMVAKDDVCGDREGHPYHDQHSNNTNERADPLLKVDQETQVRQISRERHSANATTSKEAGHKLNLGNEDQTRSGLVATSSTIIESHRVTENHAVIKQPPEVLRKGEVQKRVDEWLSQTQAQNFSGPNSDKRESGRTVALVRSSSSAESKNLRRSRNDARSRSTDENCGDKLNGTVSYDDINRTEIARCERKLERPKNITALGATRGTYKDYLAGRARSRHPTDYGFVGHGSAIRSGEPTSGSSKIPQRGQVHSRKREVSIDRKSVDHRIASSETGAKIALGTSQQEKNSTQASRSVIAEGRNTNVTFGKTKTDQVSCNGATIASTSILGNGRAASFKRARSQERTNAIAPGRNTSALVKEDQQTTTTGNPRIRGGPQHNQHHSQVVAKGQLSRMDQLQKQQNSVTSPNKVGESRRLLVASREPRVHEDSIEQPCKPVDQLIKPHQQFQKTNETEREAGGHKQDTHFAKYIGQSRCAMVQGEKEKTVESSANSTIENPSFSGGPRTLRSPDESKTSRSRLTRENCGGIEPKRPPAPPRRDQSRRKKVESTSIKPRQVSDEPCSTFRPTKRLYSALRQTQEQQSFSTGFDSRGATSELSSTKSHYAAPKQVESIYERTLQPQVIHSNDLESILKPVVRASAYGENTESGSMKAMEKSSCLSDNPILDEIPDGFLDGMDKEEKNLNRESPKIGMYPEIGLDQCLQVQRRHPAMKNTNKESSLEKRSLPTIHAKCWNQELVVEPAKTFGTFQPVNSPKPSDRTNDQSEDKESFKNTNNDDKTSLDATNQSTYQEPDLIPKIKTPLADSYEARSTLRLDRHFPSSASKDLNSDSKIEEELLSSNIVATNAPLMSESDTPDTEEKNLVVQENASGEQIAIVNEVLVKNLRFQQDLPKPEFQNVFRAAKPFNFNSVLSDDYDKIQADDCAGEHDKECEIYVTKEEMERQRLVDFLKKGDFDAVKLVSTAKILFRRCIITTENRTKKISNDS